MRQIIKILPKEERQTMLFSATYVTLELLLDVITLLKSQDTS